MDVLRDDTVATGKEKILMLDKDKKRQIIEKFATHEGDTGSPEVQVALLTQRINELSAHLLAHTHDFTSRRGLLRMVGERHRMLGYLRSIEENRYLKLISALGLRK